MKRKGAQGLPAPARVTPAANEEFTDTVTGMEDLAHRGGWDPYEVWRTRVKVTSQAKGEREHDPLR